MRLNLLQSFQIFSVLGVESIGDDLGVVSFSGVLLSVQEPLGNVVVYTRNKHKYQLPVGLAMISLIFSISASVSSPALKCQKEEGNAPLVQVDLGNLEDEVGEPTADTLDDSHGEDHLLLAIDVSVLDSENMREFLSLLQNKTLCGGDIKR